MGLRVLATLLIFFFGTRGMATGSPSAVPSGGRMPLAFEVNQGQTDGAVRFLARPPGYVLFLTGDQAVLSLQAPRSATEHRSLAGHAAASSRPAPSVVRMSLEGANRSAPSSGEERLPQASNYFIGKDPRRWHTGVPSYGRVRYRGVYPGVDLLYYGHHGQVEFDFELEAGGDPAQIRLNLEGASRVEQEASGDLRLTTAHGDLRLLKPAMYQKRGGSREVVAGDYVMLSADRARPSTLRVGLRVGAHDRARPLMVDPVLVYSTYLGGGLGDIGCDVAVDAAGNTYIAGETNSPAFPGTTGSPIQPAPGGLVDAFVSKINAAGSAVVYSTYLGGSDSDFGYGIAVDAAGEAYVVGGALSTDFPTTAGALQPVYGGGGEDGFVVKINAAGSAIVYATYLGGSGDDAGGGIAVDLARNAYVLGFTNSTDFPTSVGAIQPSNAGGNDAFVTKIDGAGSSIVYSTYLGGGGDEGPFINASANIAVDSAGNAYVTHGTDSTDFPTSGGALQSSNAGSIDAFLTKIGAGTSAAVPAVSWRGLLALGVLLAGAGTWLVRLTRM